MYKFATTFDQFDGLCGQKKAFVDTIVHTGSKVVPCTVKTDLNQNVARGFLFFVDNDMAPTVAPAGGSTKPMDIDGIYADQISYNGTIYEDKPLRSFAIPCEDEKQMGDGNLMGNIDEITRRTGSHIKSVSPLFNYRWALGSNVSRVIFDAWLRIWKA